jgi:hypothetical protein
MSEPIGTQGFIVIGYARRPCEVIASTRATVDLREPDGTVVRAYRGRDGLFKIGRSIYVVLGVQ